MGVLKSKTDSLRFRWDGRSDHNQGLNSCIRRLNGKIPVCSFEKIHGPDSFRHFFTVIIIGKKVNYIGRKKLVKNSYAIKIIDT